MKPVELLDACRCPEAFPVGDFGLWQIRRVSLDELPSGTAGEQIAAWEARRHLSPYRSYTILRRHTIETMMREFGEVVMEDSGHELRKHLPLLMVARGRVLITGLGLGCVLRGVLAKPDVEHVDVVEIDSTILQMIGPEFADDPRVTLHQGDAETILWRGPHQWDIAWHDLWTEPGTEHLDLKHARVLARYRDQVSQQGAWNLDRKVKNLWPDPLVGASRRRLQGAA